MNHIERCHPVSGVDSPLLRHCLLGDAYSVGVRRGARGLGSVLAGALSAPAPRLPYRRAGLHACHSQPTPYVAPTPSPPFRAAGLTMCRRYARTYIRMRINWCVQRTSGYGPYNCTRVLSRGRWVLYKCYTSAIRVLCEGATRAMAPLGRGRHEGHGSGL